MIILLFLCLVSLAITGSGCGLLASAVGGPESPRPKEYQVQSSAKVTTTATTQLTEVEKEKVQAINNIGVKAIEVLKDAKDPNQIRGIDSVAVKTSREVVAVDGTTGAVAGLAGKSVEDIAQMPTGQYLTYALTQGVVASRNQQAVYEGLKVGWRWTAAKVAEMAGGATGGIGLITLASLWLNKALKRRKLLIANGKAIKTFKEKHPEVWPDLKNTLASEHSEVPVDAKKEHGILI